MSNWATAADVLALTRVTVSDADVDVAQAMVEMFAGATSQQSDNGLLSSYNLRMLKLAVAYQTAWMSVHPDVFTNIDVDNVSQDGVSATLGNENARLLAPLALRCLRRLSWWNRPLVAQRRSGGGSDTGNRDSVGYDDNAADWEPL